MLLEMNATRTARCFTCWLDSARSPRDRWRCQEPGCWTADCWPLKPTLVSPCQTRQTAWSTVRWPHCWPAALWPSAVPCWSSSCSCLLLSAPFQTTCSHATSHAQCPAKCWVRTESYRCNGKSNTKIKSAQLPNLHISSMYTYCSHICRDSIQYRGGVACEINGEPVVALKTGGTLLFTIQA